MKIFLHNGEEGILTVPFTLEECAIEECGHPRAMNMDDSRYCRAHTRYTQQHQWVSCHACSYVGIFRLGDISQLQFAITDHVEDCRDKVLGKMWLEDELLRNFISPAHSRIESVNTFTVPFGDRMALFVDVIVGVYIDRAYPRVLSANEKHYQEMIDKDRRLSMEE